ncbi:MAG: outer membrane lipoprotein-sorting protein [Gammaproteobacteria bacterium]|nr:outer membrane lipoprotein-sorting protein [Gammaproteobacteria bacterium]
MKKTICGLTIYGVFTFLCLETQSALAAVNVKEKPDVLEIVSRCDNKNPGSDQQSRMSITITAKNGQKRTTTYLRLWRDMKGDQGLLDKMVLFTLYPPDSEGTGFMRWGYDHNQEKNAQQWVYLPNLRSLRRVSVRDLGESFLGSDLTYGDITPRLPEQDKHELLRIVKDKDGDEFYLVESIPIETDSIYSRKESWYKKTADPKECVKTRIDYYDRKGAPLKKQTLSWQRINNAWMWKEVSVKNAQTMQQSLFEIDHVKIDQGIDDDMFSERRLRLGIR